MTNSKITALFDGWEEVMIWSALQGHMGTVFADNEENPTAAIIDIGDFCFLAGVPNPVLLQRLTGAKLLVPRDALWEQLIEKQYGACAKKILRYAIKKEAKIFDREKLQDFVAMLEPSYHLRAFDQEAFEAAKREAWAGDLCSQFADYSDYKKRAVGVAIFHQGNLVAGASPYAIYDGGIEIEIDTKPEHRRKGLATVCGAKLILECLDKGLYPSWDAHDLRSVALAEKLGYHIAFPYAAYEVGV